MRVISVSIDYPGPGNPRRGLFVQRRLAALGRLETVRVVHLEPWFPLLRPRPRPAAADFRDDPPAVRPGMFYLPGVLKGLDSYWVKRAVVPAVRALEAAGGPADLIDAHFSYPEGAGCVRAARVLNRP